tara:strand:- start:1422 stop:1793 length:372 start_codon:yes stop_codon:yes gene_type:complete
MYWFLIKSILSAVLGSQFYQWYASTKIGIYFQNRIDQFMEYIAKKYDITLMKKQSKFERDYPLMMERIEALEKWSHPDRKADFNKVIKKTEKRLEALENRQDARIYTDSDYIDQVIGKKEGTD